MAYQRKNASKLRNMNVNDIRYTQDTISDTFSDGTPIQYTIDMLKRNEIKPEDIEPIRVGKYRKRYRTIDNRRLYCFKQSNIETIQVKYSDNIFNLRHFHDKYTTKNGGTSIKIRKEHFYCGICCRIMQISDKISHLNGKGHHQNASKYKNSKDNTQNKLLIRDEAIIACGWTATDKNTNVTGTKSAKISRVNNINAVGGKKHKKEWKIKSNIKTTVKKASLNFNKLGSDNDNKANSKNTSENNKRGNVNANDKEISNVTKCKPKNINALRSRELELGQIIAAKEQQINAHKIKFDAMQEQINNFQIKLKKKQQINNYEINTLRSKELELEQIITTKEQQINTYKIKLDAIQEQINTYKIELRKGQQINNYEINALRSRELQLEQIIAAKGQQINAYEIKFDAMEEQINNYEIKLGKMEQLSNVVIDVGVDLDSKKQYKSENKKKICTTFGFVCGTLSFGAVCILAKKYI